MAVQLAHLAGAEVTALVRDPAASADVLRRLGATVVVLMEGVHQREVTVGNSLW
jgi:NADPH:quinone reductase-like Zn-dependent oxidoreductase